jgi:hypothetical protein
VTHFVHLTPIGLYSRKRVRSEAMKVWNALSSRRRKRLARVPQDSRVYGIGDVHGRADLLAQLFSEIDADLKEHPARRTIHIFLGDTSTEGRSPGRCSICWWHAASVMRRFF